MGSIPWAARDPIFWLHHSNIDRIWASWNNGGRANPTGSWLMQSFVFADESGNRVDSLVGDFLETDKLKVGAYKYDKLEAVPPLAVAAAAAPTGSLAPSLIADQAQPGPINLKSDEQVTIALAASTVSVPAAAHAIKPFNKIFLVLRNLQANVQPGILYDVYPRRTLA
jgi:tyrosinase